MKKSFFYAVGSVSLLLGGGACSSADAPATAPPAAAPQTDFFIKAAKNGARWTAPGTGTFSQASQEFSLLGQAGTAAKAEVLALGLKLPASPALAPVRALPAAWRVLLGFDAVVDSYAGSPQLTITRLDTVAHLVEGRFEGTLLRDKQWSAQPDSLRLTDGSFRVRYTTVP